VDSELIFRLADRFAPEGPIDQEGLKKALVLRQLRVALYSSEPAFIDFAVDFDPCWRELEALPMTMLTIRYEDERPSKTANSASYPRSAKGHYPKE
jgi:hypothetical protein